MAFGRIESVILYTCAIIFLIVILALFYRLCTITVHKLQAQYFPDRVRRNTRERRVQQLLARPGLMRTLATRIRTEAEREAEREAREAAANASPPPPCRTPVVRFSPEMAPPAYDTLSTYSGPPPSYHSDIEGGVKW